jgi:lipopolysaccharide transport system ATP-binding protein
MPLVVQITNLSKIYRLGEIGTGTISHDLERWFKMKIIGQEDPFLKIGETNERNKKGKSELVYSLKNINLDIRQGEALGIIGKNGAGKSTLLKIISRVTSPSTGKIKIKGRIASLLEVGTGFHPELTGRENIFLNGAILGMRKKEISKKLDEIIDFSGVERYIDTPVKRYSSGMYVRLAFAVAAHLEPEILVVDEVLAVGDAQFQKKCLGKMDDVAKGGRTVLFVSHNMAAIENLCQRTIWLDEGKLMKDAKTHQVIHDYLSMFLSEDVSIDLENFKDRSGTGEAHIVHIRLLNGDSQPSYSVRMGERLKIRLSIRYEGQSEKQVTLGMYLHTEDGILVSDFRTNHMGFDTILNMGTSSFDLIIDSILLYPRTYVVSPWIMDSYMKEDIDWVRYAAKFEIEASDFLGTGAHFTSEYGITHIKAQWSKVMADPDVL